jgi:hypothetical protein
VVRTAARVALSGSPSIFAASAASPRPGFVALSIGALVMAVFHGMRGAFWLNRVLGKPIPAPVYAHR